MNKYLIRYANGEYIIVSAKSALEVVRKYDLATREHITTKITQLELTEAQQTYLNGRF